jgi:hypothetical protein
MTACVRQFCNPTFTDPAIGQVLNQGACIDVRWRWLAPPAALVYLTSLFFFAMVLETQKRSELNSSWNSSPLLPMFHGPEPETQECHGHGEIYRVHDMRVNADYLHVRLTPTDKSCKFTEVETDRSET